MSYNRDGYNRDGKQSAKFRALRRSRDSRLREQLINELLLDLAGYIRYLSHQYASGKDPQEDLAQEGVIALIHAVDRYDPERGVKFSTYAQKWIRGAMERYVARSGLLRRTEAFSGVRRDAANIKSEWTGHLVRRPSDAEIAGALGISETTAAQALLASGRLYSLDTDTDATGVPLHEAVAAPEPTREHFDHQAAELGAVVGDVFVWAALLAPLPTASRDYALQSISEGSPAAKRRDTRQRCLQTWKEVGWAQWLYDGSIPFQRAYEALIRDLRASGDPLRQENAAFVVWLMHGVDCIRRRCPGDQVRDLAEQVLAQALSSQDVCLQWIATHIWEIIERPTLADHLGVIRPVRHVVDSEHFRTDDETIEKAIAALRHSTGELLLGKARNAELFVTWDVAAMVARFCSADVHDTVAADPTFAGRGAYVLSAIAARRSTGEAISRLYRVLRETGERRVSPPETVAGLARTIEDILNESLGGHPLSAFKRRVATMMLRHVGAAERVSLSRQALSDESAFVRLSAVSSLRVTATRDAFDLLHEHFVRSLRAKKRPVQLIEASLGTLIRLDTRRGIQLCQPLLKERNPELRGRALAWLGEFRRRYEVHAPDRLRQDLLALLPPRRETAMNVAQCLIAPIGLPDYPRSGAEYGVIAPYRPPVWRMDLSS